MRRRLSVSERGTESVSALADLVGVRP